MIRLLMISVLYNVYNCWNINYVGQSPTLA